MFKNACMLSIVFLTLVFQAHFAKAGDKSHDGWDIKVNGYVQMDSNFDSTRTYTEQLNAAGVARNGTVNGDNGRTQMSARASRLYLKMNLPETADGWKTKGWFESDFQGYDPAPQGPAGGPNSEASFFTAPTFRLRNAYFVTEKNGWSLLAGQNWAVFGYQPFYEIVNTSNSTPINLIQRTPQIKISKAMSIGNSIRYTVDVAAERPTQRDSNIPNFDLGARAFYDGRKSGFLHWVGGDYNLEPTSIGISGTVRQFTTPNAAGNTADKLQFMGGGLAVSAIVPILTASDDKSMKNNLTFCGEFVNGSGIADNYSGWTGGLGAMGAVVINTVPAAQQPNLDTGIAGYDSSANFQLVQTQEFTGELQYILPTETTMAVNLEYARLHSANSGNLNSLATNVAYDYVELYGVDFFYEFSENIRFVAEYSRMLTHYVDGVYPTNSRYGISAFFMF